MYQENQDFSACGEFEDAACQKKAVAVQTLHGVLRAMKETDSAEPVTAVKFGDAPLSYHNKPVTLVLDHSPKKYRKLLDVFNQHAARGSLPALAEKPVILEWGNADGMRLPFVEVQQGSERKAFVHIKEYDLPAGDVSGASAAAEKTRVFVTGTCLFGKHGAAGTTDKGKTLYLCDPYQMRTATPEEYGRMETLDIIEHFHAYEVLSPLSRHNVLEMVGPDKVYFNVPYIPYILYAKDAIDKGLMNPGLMDEWAEKLEQRIANVIAYEEKISSAEVIPVDPLLKYKDAILEPGATVAQLADMIAKDDPWWAKYFEVNPPDSFAALGYGSYVKVYYDALNDESVGELCAVEDQVEMKILLELKRLVEKSGLPSPAGESRAVGYYPFTGVLFPDPDGKAAATFLSDVCGRKDLADGILDKAAEVFGSDLAERAKLALRGPRGENARKAAAGADANFHAVLR
ncbi:MAG: hypothetical protein HYU57_06740 [Micavibrio aeruginosavorus]|nr:hypothetical protein [Micavibrio aeruginosavorus]